VLYLFFSCASFMVLWCRQLHIPIIVCFFHSKEHSSALHTPAEPFACQRGTARAEQRDGGHAPPGLFLARGRTHLAPFVP